MSPHKLLFFAISDVSRRFPSHVSDTNGRNTDVVSMKEKDFHKFLEKKVQLENRMGRGGRRVTKLPCFLFFFICHF